MPEFLSCEEAYRKHKRLGSFIKCDTIDKPRALSMLGIAKADLGSASALLLAINKDSTKYSSVYKLFYDALHEAAESIVMLDGMKIDNHQGLFAFLCHEHKELELSWDFFEKARTKRNGINYYGQPITSEELKSSKVFFELYVKTLTDYASSHIGKP